MDINAGQGVRIPIAPFIQTGLREAQRPGSVTPIYLLVTICHATPAPAQLSKGKFKKCIPLLQQNGFFLITKVRGILNSLTVVTSFIRLLRHYKNLIVVLWDMILH